MGYISKFFRNLFLQTSPGDKIYDFVKSDEGISIYVNVDDSRGRELIERRGNLNPPTLAIWHLLLRSEGWTHVIDVGTNYGEMLANGGLPPRARIIAVEPNREILPYLRKTLKQIGKITLHDVALSDKEGVSDLLITEDWSGTTRLVTDGQGTTKVSTTTLDRILENERVPAEGMNVLLKIDVEGHEAKVLSGLTKKLLKFRKFAALIELHHLQPADMQWIASRFDMWAYNTDTKSLVAITSFDWDSSPSLYRYDIVIRRKSDFIA